jgi:hypothetical protein
MVLVAMALLLLLGASAIAIDLAAMRLDRSADQKVTDSAASAGALAAFEGTGQDACIAALEYVAINSEGIASIDTSVCAGVPASCDSSSVPMPYSPPSPGRFDITFTYPVDDTHELMTSAQLGAPTQLLVPDDGTQCERVGVEMSATHQSLFAQLIGFDQGTTTVHSVARAFEPPPDGPPLNLVVLDRFGTDGCGAMVVQGNGGIIVEKVVDPATGDEFPGVAAADSDALAGCSGADPSVIRIDGSNSLLRADGPPCPTDPVNGQGCGQIMSLALGTPGCNQPACTPGAGGGNPPIPEEVQPMTSRLTRAQIDHEYNCWPDYTSPLAGTAWAVDPLRDANEQSIGPCPSADGANHYIYDLIEKVGPAPGNPVGLGIWNSWTGSGGACTYDTSDADVSVSGNFVIDCPTFTVKRHIQITGNVVFDGIVNVTSSDGHLDINNSLGSPGWAVFRGGRLIKDGQADLTFDHTAVYMSKNSGVAISGGNACPDPTDPSCGKLTWIAPDSGRFNDLALWSDSASMHQWAGQGQLTMIGVFFSPWATADYSGTSGQNQTDAQWVADKLVTRGQGLLVVTPKFEFPFKVDAVPRTTIIR